MGTTTSPLDFDGLPASGVGWMAVVVMGVLPISGGCQPEARLGADEGLSAAAQPYPHQHRGILRYPVRLVRVSGAGSGAAWCGAGAALVRLVRVTIFTLGAGLVRGVVVTVFSGAGRFPAKNRLQWLNFAAVGAVGHRLWCGSVRGTTGHP